ncbi:MAG: DJ-1/PfpI family protein [Treponema sp.]|jgi:4-methyl-5(b-hydroxyethyl)-thiazole monophosphate biosynthesis|nr:DJ-1/PfpI family protein [Treponema sp.]
MLKKALVFLADGFEEVEAATPVDYLRRARIKVTTVSVGGNKTVTGAHGLPIIADSLITELPAGAVWDILVCPGGMPGASNIAASASACALLKAQAAAGRWVAAICASPAVVLSPLGLLRDRRAVCFPGMEDKTGGACWVADSVAIDGNIITSRGPGTAGLFAVAIIRMAVNREEADKVAASVLLAE